MASSSQWERGWDLALVSAQSSASETELAARDVSADDMAALVHAYSSLLYRVAHSILRNRAESEDAVQDVFLRVLQYNRKTQQRRLSEVLDLRAAAKARADAAIRRFLHTLLAPLAVREALQPIPSADAEPREISTAAPMPQPPVSLTN